MRKCNKRNGLTSEEERAHDRLMDALSAFGALDKQHPDETRDFVDGVHKCQDVLLTRVVRRAYPEGWPTYKKTSTGVWSKIQPKEGLHHG